MHGKAPGLVDVVRVHLVRKRKVLQWMKFEGGSKPGQWRIFNHGLHGARFKI
jgi:hypothetical protein